MSATSTPYGFRPLNMFNGGVSTRDVWALPGGISAAYSTDILQFQPVYLTTDGVLNPVAANNIDFLGVFLGVQFVAVAGGTPMWLNYWPASTSFVAGSLIAYCTRDPNLLFRVQADGAVSSTAVGDQVNITNFSAGSTVTGMSRATVSATPVGAGVQGQWRVEGLYLMPNNAWADVDSTAGAYTDLVVSIARSQYVANKVAI